MVFTSLQPSQLSKLEEYTKIWWQWFYSAKNIDDLTRQPQSQPLTDVFFLPSIIGNFDKEKEPMYLKTKIPANKTILVNVAKWMSFGLPFMSDDELRKMAQERINTLSQKTVEVDEEQINPQRIITGQFILDLKRDIINPKGVSYTRINHIRKGKYKVIGDGYWLFIKDLDKGKHTIHTLSVCEAGIVNIDVYHELEIV